MKRTTVTIVAAVAMLAALSGSAKAALLTFNLKEVGSNVVGTVSGTLNTNALTQSGTRTNTGGLYPSSGGMIVGPEQWQYGWAGLVRTASSFGTTNWLPANTMTGDTVGITLGGTKVYVSPSYVSGNALSGGATWLGNSFATLGITKGTYTMTYNGGTDSVVLQVEAVPEPATMTLLVLGGIATLIRRRRNRR